MEVLSYRPRNAGHDYYGRGTYLITLVVSGRESLLSHLVTDFGRKYGSDFGRKQTRLALTPLGEAVQETWLNIPAHQSAHGNNVAVHACVCMPDHFHGVIEVLEPMQWSLGDIIQAFKAVCTSRWQQGQGLPSSTNRPISVDCFTDSAPAWLREKATQHYNEGALIRAMSKKQRQEYYTFVGRSQRDLDTMGDVGNVPSDSDYSRFHNLNTLAAEISTFNGEAKIIR